MITTPTPHTLKRREYLQSYAMIAISVIGLALLVIYPLGWILRFSLYRYDGISEPIYVGMSNFIRAFGANGARYWQTVRNTFVFAFGKLLVEIPLALVLAYIVAGKIKGRSFFRTVYFLPSMLSVAVMGIMFYYLFGSYSGAINEIVRMFGGAGNTRWFSSGTLAMIVIMIASVWQNFGINMLFFMTGLQSIPEDLYEAATIDGANSVQRIFRITIQMLAPVSQKVIKNAQRGSLKVIELLLAMTNGAPNFQTEMMMSYVYKLFFASTQLGTANNFGYGAALSVITAVILTVVTLIYLRVTHKGSEIHD